MNQSIRATPFQTALVTGASKGLGLFLSQQLYEAGAKVVMVARDATEVEAAARQIDPTSERVFGISADVGDKLATYRLAGEAAGLIGDIELLVHNASTLGPVPMPPLLDLACEDLGRVLEVNTVGPFRLTKAIAGGMALRQQGTIVFVSSDAASEAYPNWGAYGLSKAASDHLARTLSAELEEHGVRVLSVDPGEMDTAMHRAALPEADPQTLAAPALVARAILAMLADPERAPSGSRQLAATWRAA